MSHDIHLLKHAFLVYVRPIVEHNSVIWSLYTARDIDAVESVQRRFTKRLPTLSNVSYNDRLSCLNISSLELRRLHDDLFWCYKVVFGLVLINWLEDLFVFSPCQVTRGHKFKLRKRQNTHSVRANFFSERVTTCWNLTLVLLQVLSALLNKSISHSFLEFKFVIRPSLLSYVFCSIVLLFHFTVRYSGQL